MEEEADIKDWNEKLPLDGNFGDGQTSVEYTIDLSTRAVLHRQYVFKVIR